MYTLILFRLIPRWRLSRACRLVSVSFSENIVWEYLIGLAAASSRNLGAKKTGTPSWYMNVRGRAGFSTMGPRPKAPVSLPETLIVPDLPPRPATLLEVFQLQVPISSV